MTATSVTRTGGNWLLWLILAGLLVFFGGGSLMAGLEMESSAPAAAEANALDWEELDLAHAPDAEDAIAPLSTAELPPISIIDGHAFVKHAEATRILQDYSNRDFICLTAYRSLTRNRILIRMRLKWTTLEAGIIIRTSGVIRTIMLARPGNWDSCLTRYEYDPVPFMQIGSCMEATP